MTPVQPHRLAQSTSGEGGVAPGTANPGGRNAFPTIPDHELLRCIGQGSYGEVWLGRTVLGEYRAVKVVYRRAFGDNRPFEREFEGIQRYEPFSRSHPSQVQILHVGINQADGYFYYVMELADPAISNQFSAISKGSGRRDNESLLTDYYPRTLRCDLEYRTRLPLGECIQIGLALTTALEHLHEHGLVHRDVKPSNIIFVQGVAKLADIGLVTDAGDGKSIVGTEGYLAPEGPGTPSADLYSLGKVLYEISAGRDRRHFPDLPSNLEGWPDRQGLLELNEILLKACARESRQRYSSASAMRDDLATLQRGESVKRRRLAAARFLIGKRVVLVTACLALLALGFWWIANTLSSGTAPPAIKPSPRKLTSNLDALNAYSEGRYAYNKNSDSDLTNALHHFERATSLDPKLAEAYAGLASTYTWIGFPENLSKARAPAEKALTLNTNLPEAHKTLAILKYLLDWDWAEAEKEFQLALRLEPSGGETLGETLRAYGYYLKNMGRTREAISVLIRARELDSRAISVARILGNAFFAAGDYEQAIKQYQAWIGMEPNAPVARWNLAEVYEEQGLFEKAINSLQEEYVLLGEDPRQIDEQSNALREAYANGGAEGYWRKSLEYAKQDPTTSPYDLARLHARLGEKASAFEYLYAAVQQRDIQLILGLKTDRAFDKYRREPEYRDLLRKMHWE